MKRNWKYKITPDNKILSSNGKILAECKTENTARKIVRGLHLYDEQKVKLDKFRL